MPVGCARCGAVNPDGNQFCQACGAPLVPAAAGAGTAPVATAPPPGPPAGAPPPGPPPGIAPPLSTPAGYQSPYYTPPVPVAPVHRTPWTMIIAGVVLLAILAIGVGTGLAILRGNSNDANGASATLPSPTPAGTPSPVATSTGKSNPGVVNNVGETVTVPPGWSVANQDSETVTLTDPNDSGAVTIASGPSNPNRTAQQNMDDLDTSLRSKYPDTRICPGTNTSTSSFNGANGIYWDLCFTLTSGNQSVPAVAWMFAGANSDGSVYYVVMVLTAQGNLSTLLNEAKPVLQGIHWKL